MFSCIRRNPIGLFTGSSKTFRPSVFVSNRTLKKSFRRTVYSSVFNHVDILGHYPKWGFIIYRCDYRSDTAWKTFIEGWSALTERGLRVYGGQDLMQTLDFRVREHQPTLDGATVEQVREMFTKWRESEEGQEAIETEFQQNLQDGNYSFARNGFRIHVDAKALDLCLAYLALDQDGKKRFDRGVYRWDPDPFEAAPYVNIVIEGHTRECETSIVDEEPEDEGDVDREDEIEIEEDTELEPISAKLFLPQVLPGCFASLFHNPNAFEGWTQPYYSQTEEKFVVL